MENFRMSGLVEYARGELERADLFDTKDIYGGNMGLSIMRLIEAFSNERYSGLSASVAIHILEKLARYQPLSPLTGEDAEWNDVSEYNDGKALWQNKRCSRVFKDASDKAYDIEGIIYEDETGNRYIRNDSSVSITFPYMPKQEVRKYGGI